MSNIVSNIIHQEIYETCRICGENNNVAYNIFETSYGKYTPISEIFEESMSTKLSTEDGQSHMVCSVCLEGALSALELKSTWQNSHNSLEKYLQYNSTSNEEGITQETCDNEGSDEEIETYDEIDGDVNIPRLPEELSGLYECRLCNKPFFTFKNLQHHIVSQVHSTICNICKIDFYDANALKKHFAEHKSKKLTLCGWCGGVVSNGYHNSEFNFSCPFCNHIYPCNLFLQNHVAHDHPEHEFLLSQVKVEKNNRSDLFENAEEILEEDLWQVVKNNADIIEYKCSQCEKVFGSMAKLERHISQLRCVYVCDICSNKYKVKIQLKNHIMDKHLGIRPYACNVCSKSFVRRGMLKSHQQVHIQEKRFQCHECGKKFVSAATLNYHSRLHTGEKPYVCMICGEAFVKCSRLREHEQKWHIGKLQCPVCLTTFAQRCSLKTHMDRFHPNTYDRKCNYLQNQNQTLEQQKESSNQQ